MTDRPEPPPKQVTHIPRNLRRALVERGKTQRDAYEYLDMSWPTWRRRMLNPKGWRTDELIRLGEWLGVRPDWFTEPPRDLLDDR